MADASSAQRKKRGIGNVMPWKDKNGAQVIKNGRQSWRLRWEVDDPGTGRRKYEYRTEYGPRRAVEALWIEHETEIRHGGVQYARPAKETLSDYLHRWLADYGVANHLKITTMASHRTHVETHIIPALGAVPLRDLTAAQVSAWQADMLRKQVRRGRPRKPVPPGEVAKPEKPAKPLSPKRVLNARMTLHTALAEAVRLELIPSNPVDKVRPPKQSPKTVDPYTAEQVAVLSASAAGHRLEAMFDTAWQTGLRMGELLGLRWSDLDLEAATVRLSRTAATIGGPVFMQEAKTEASARTLALPPETVAALRAHRKRQAQERLKRGSEWQDHGLVFPTSKGTPIQLSAMERTWYSVRDKAGLPQFGFHALRHTYASIALSNGMPLEMVSENLGHKSVAFTKRVYAKYLPDAKRRAAELMSGVIARVKAGGQEAR